MFYHALTGNGGTTPTEDLRPVLLWENSNPTAEFAAKTISLDLTDYAGVIVEFKKTTTSTKINTRLYAKKNEDVDAVFGAGSYYTKGDSNTARGVNVTDAGVTFAEGYGNMTLNNKTTIPIRIYGVKEYVVEPANNLQLITTSQDKTITFTAEDNVNYLVIESAYNGSGTVNIRECSIDNGELEVLKHLVEAKLETYTALIKNAVGTVNYSSVATSDGAMILIFKLVR